MPRERKKVVEESPSNGKLAVKEPEVVEVEVVPEQSSPFSESERDDLESLEVQIRSEEQDLQSQFLVIHFCGNYA